MQEIQEKKPGAAEDALGPGPMQISIMRPDAQTAPVVILHGGPNNCGDGNMKANNLSLRYYDAICTECTKDAT